MTSNVDTSADSTLGTTDAPPSASRVGDRVDTSDPEAVVITTAAGRVLRIPRLPRPGPPSPPAPALPAPLFRALTPAARGVVELADRLREEHGRPDVFVEHLLLALLLEEGGPGPTLLQRARLSLGDVRTRLEALGFDAVRTVVEPDGRVSAVLPAGTGQADRDVFPRGSPHVDAAIAEAATLAGWQPGRPVGPDLELRARHLLDGLRRVETSEVVRLFPDLWELADAVRDDRERDGGRADPAAEEFVPRYGEIAARADDPAPTVVHELAPDQLQELLPSLSASVRRALGVADALRRARGGDAVHVEHLVVGVHAEPGGHQWYAFDAAGLTPERLAERLARFELRVRPAVSDRDNSGTRLDVPRSTPVDAMPPLSAHARLALAATAFAAGWTPGQRPQAGAVQARHLLTGLFSVRDCSVVQALADARPALHAALERRIDQDVAAGDFSAELGADQHHRLDLLLAEPPRVAFAPLAAPAPPPRAAVGAGRGGTNDRAEGEDQLGFAYYVSAFAELVDSPDTRPPLTIGIFGSWGQGKSFLLAKLKETVRQRSARLRPSELREAGRRLRRRLRGEPPPARERAFVYCVDFNAWEYNASEKIWPRLVRRILDTVDRAVDWRTRPLLYARVLAHRVRRNLGRKLRDDWRDLLAWAAVGAVLGGIASWDPPGARESLYEFVFDRQVDTLTLTGFLGGLTALVKLVKDTLFAPLGAWITALADDGRSYGAESDFMALVRRDLELLDGRLAAEGSRVLIVIDDLDRCEPEKAVEMLQAINLLLDRPSFIICLGIDARVVTAAVERHYRELLGPAGITGYEYLDKIVQIPFSIPEPTADDLADFVARQMNRSAPRKGEPRAPAPATPPPGTPQSRPALPASLRAAGVDDTAPQQSSGSDQGAPPPSTGTPTMGRDEAATRAAVQARSFLDATDGVVAPLSPAALVARAARDVLDGVLDPGAEVPESLSFTEEEELAFRAVTPYLRRNPRHVKRLVNVYALVRSLAVLRDERRILDDPAATVRWLTLCGQWPYATRELLRAAAELERAGLTPDVAGGPPLAQLLDRVASGLDPARRRRFDHTPELLADLVRTSDDLSWDELLVLRSYTLNFNPALESELRAVEARRASAEG